MKKNVALFLMGICLGTMSFAQDQLENPGFEEWDIILPIGDTIREPVQWSSLKTSDNANLATLAPVVCARSNEAHSGNYSLKLTNISVFGIVANGIVTNGRLHPDFDTEKAFSYTDTINDQWNTPFTSRPDSIAGWYQFTPSAGDSLQVKITLHQGYGQQPDGDFENNWIGVAEFKSGLNTEGVWTRFSAPFTYYSEAVPEYALAVITSGNAYVAVDSSSALFDDLEMIYRSTSSSPQALKPEGIITAPRTGTLWLRNLPVADYRQFSIYSITGRKVWQGRVDSEWIDISEAQLPAGIYLVSLTSRNRIFTQKVLLR